MRSSSTSHGSLPLSSPEAPTPTPGYTSCPRTPLRCSTTHSSQQTSGSTCSCTSSSGSKSPPCRAGRWPGLPPSPTPPPPHLPGWAVSQAPGASVWMGFGAHKLSVRPDLCLERTKQFRKVCPQGPPVGDFSPGATGEWARPTCLPHKVSPAPPRRAHAHTSTVPRAGAYDIITAIH